MAQVKAAVIGAGYMGRAHARVLSRIASERPGLVELEYIVDVDYSRARHVASVYGGEPLSSIQGIPRGSVDFAVVATPTTTHFAVVEALVSRDIGAVLVEKPATPSLEEYVELLRLAEENGLWATVGHIERYNPAVAKLLEKTLSGVLGELLTTVSRRVGPFAARVGDTSVVYDLAVHEIDISLLLYRSVPHSLRSYTLESIVSNLADYALIVLSYQRGFSSIEVNRVTPFKERTLYITGSQGVARLDYMRQELEVFVGDEERRVIVRREEPLYLEDLDAVESLASKKEPPVDLYQAFIATLLCEKSLESTKLSRELVIEDDPEYSRHRDIVAKGIEGIARFVEEKTGKS